MTRAPILGVEVQNFGITGGALLYFFNSPHHGACVLEAKTSGKNGFGQPKYFVISTADQPLEVRCTLWYRDNSDVTITSGTKRNSDLIRLAIGQFCAFSQVTAAESGELNLQSASFEGALTNRFGRLLLTTSLLPKARLEATNELNHHPS